MTLSAGFGRINIFTMLVFNDIHISDPLECHWHGNVYNDGDKILLNCSAELYGDESMTPTIEWYRDGVAIEGSDESIK